MSSIVVAGDTSGSVTLQAPAVAGSTTLTLPTSSGTVLTTASGQVLTAPVLGTPASGSLVNCTDVNYTGFKNRIINGGMVINQRGYGSTPISTDPVYTLDRWRNSASGGGAFSSEQSTTVPNGNFTNSLKLTVTTADSSIESAEYYSFNQIIEGYNIADLGFGTSSAKSVTISFWVQSSLTGTYGCTICNSVATRSYVSLYSIPVANTWTYITLTIPGDTSGTWLTTNGIGLYVIFSLGNGTSRQTATPNTWSSTFAETTSAQSQWIATSGATFYITGVQLEKGSVATSFDQRAYSQELAMCERYYEQTFFVSWGATYSNIYPQATYRVQKRATPTLTFSAANGGFTANIRPLGFYQNSANSLGAANAITVYSTAEL